VSAGATRSAVIYACIVQITCWRKVFSRAIPSTMFSIVVVGSTLPAVSLSGWWYKSIECVGVCTVSIIFPKKVLCPDLRWDSI